MFSQILEQFRQNVDSVRNVLGMDSEILVFTLTALRGRQEKLARLKNPNLDLTNTIQLVEKIREGGSLSKRFDVVRNQCIVLLVSYFGSAISDLFKTTFAQAMQSSRAKELLKFELKVSVSELQSRGFDLNESFPEIFVEKAGISFQDMGSTVRAFSQYLEISIEKDELVNDLIAAQACRHVLVHAGNSVDKKLLGQLRTANPRKLKPDLQLNDTIQFSDEEVEYVISQMQIFIEKLVDMSSKASENDA